ncbi:TonB-dependent receptor domain-containing protein [Ferrimonas senticii]|uniref:TonB-dependent receptor domain-containing protein n=1 Tax=Ferrimonas senticii TaxID=394566 RepID=UPI001F0B2C15|nr:TonB-dependent receptor [Ferrimonas senticii]
MLIEVIDRDQIERIAPKSVADLLVTLPSVNIVQSGGAGQITTVAIRGANTGHTLVLLDGVRIGSATSGSADLSSLPPQMIERVEVLRGPRAAMWGSDAIGGVVQIFTRKLHSGEWTASGETGSNDFGRLTAAIGVSHGDGSSTISINGETSNGIDAADDAEFDKDGYQRVSLAINGEQHLNDAWRMTWVGQVTDGEYDYDSEGCLSSDWPCSMPYDDGSDAADYLNYHYQLGLHFSFDIWQSSLTISQMQDDNTTYKSGVADSNFVTERDQLSWIGQAKLESLTLATGFDLSQEQVSGSAYEEDKRDNYGVFASAAYALDKLTTEAVVRFDEVGDIDSETTYNLSAAYQLAPEWRFTVSHGTAFKAPTFNQLYWPGLDPDRPAVNAERSRSSEINMLYQQANWSAFASIYTTDVDDLIAGWPPENIAKASLDGFETGVAWAQGNWSVDANYSYLDATDDSTGKTLDNRAAHSLNGLVVYQWNQVELGARYNFRSKATDGGVELDPYHLVGLSVSYPFANGWQLRVNANNLLDEDSITNDGYFAPGREFYVGVSYMNF